MKCGTPVMPLDRLGHAKTDQKKGNYKAVTLEALGERRSADPDIDRAKTDSNIYIDSVGCLADDDKKISAKTLTDYWDRLAHKHEQGMSRKMRKDAKIGGSGIAKISADELGDMPFEEQIQLYKDSYDVIRKIFADRGMVVDCGVIHVDEVGIHLHYFFHDPDYKMSDKVGLPLFNALNGGEFPPAMRARGWDVADLTGYQEDTAGMSDDVLREYKAKRKLERQEHGRSSVVYKAQKDAERIKKEADQLYFDTVWDCDRLRRQIQAEREQLQEEWEQLKAEKEKMHRIKAAQEYAQNYYKGLPDKIRSVTQEIYSTNTDNALEIFKDIYYLNKSPYQLNKTKDDIDNQIEDKT